MDIYYYRNKKHDWGQAEECLLPYISEERKKKIAHMRRDSDKELSLYVELLCRYGVVQRLNCKPENIGIGKTNAGKPYVVAAGANPVEISLSHSGEYVVCCSSVSGRIYNVFCCSSISGRLFRSNFPFGVNGTCVMRI